MIRPYFSGHQNRCSVCSDFDTARSIITSANVERPIEKYIPWINYKLMLEQETKEETLARMELWQKEKS